MERVEYDLLVRTAKADAAIAASAKRARELFERKGLQLNVKAANLPLGRITGDLNKFSDSLDAAASRVLAFTATTTAIYGMATAFTRLFTESIKLEKQLASIDAILQTSSSNLQFFSSELLSIANATGQSFDLAATAAEEFARQGLSVEQTLEATNTAMAFAKIAGVGVTQAVENLTAALNTFSDEALTYTSILDTITNLDANFAVSAAGLADGLKRVGSVASESGIEMKEILSLLSSVQQVSARGTPVIANGLKTIFTRLGRSGVQDALGQIGVETKETNGEFRNYIAVLSDLANVFDTLSDSQKAFILEQVGGVYQINTLQSTLKTLRGEYTLFDKAVNVAADSTGSAAERMKILTSTTDSNLQVLKNNLGRFLAETGKITVKPILDNLVGIGNEILPTLINSLKTGEPELEKKGFELGSFIADGLIGAIQSTLAGPGTVLLVITIGKLLTKLSQDAFKAIAVLSGLKKVSITDSDTQKAVNQAILTGNKYLVERLRTTNDIVVKTQTLNTLLAESAAKQQRFQIDSIVAAGLSNAGRKAGTPRPGKAAGFVPNFANEGQLLESVGAKQHGYKAGRAYETRIHDGTGKSHMSYVNSAEDVINFTNSAGKKATMVVPPNGFGKGTTYAAEGFVPNFVSEKAFMGTGVKGAFYRLNNDVGVKKFHRDRQAAEKEKYLPSGLKGLLQKARKQTIVEDVRKEFSASKLLADVPIMPGVAGVQIPDTLERATRTGSIRKQIVKDYTASETLGFDIGKQFGNIIANGLKKRGLRAQDLHGDNYSLNFKGSQFVRRNKDYFKTKRTPETDEEFFQKMVAEGGQATIFDAGHINPTDPKLQEAYKRYYTGKGGKSSGFVPNFVRASSEMGRGIEGSFHRLSGDVGVKRFYKNQSKKEIRNKVEDEFSLSRLLSEGNLTPGITGPKIVDTLDRAVRASSIRKQIIKDPMALESIGRAPAIGFGKILEGQMYDSGVFVRDLIGENYSINREGQAFLKQHLEYLSSRRAGASFDLDNQLYQDFVKAGGKATIVDAGMAEVRSKEAKEKINQYKHKGFNKGFVPNFAEKNFPIKLFEFTGASIPNKGANRQFGAAQRNYNVEWDDRINDVGFKAVPIEFPNESGRFAKAIINKPKSESKKKIIARRFEKFAIGQLNRKGYKFKDASLTNYNGKNSAIDGYSVDIPNQTVDLLEVKSGEWPTGPIFNKFGRFLPENILKLGPELEGLFKEGNRDPNVVDNITLRNIVAVPNLIGDGNFRGGLERDRAGVIREYYPAPEDLSTLSEFADQKTANSVRILDPVFKGVEDPDKVKRVGQGTRTSSIHQSKAFVAPTIGGKEGEQTIFQRNFRGKGGSIIHGLNIVESMKKIQAENSLNQKSSGFIPNFSNKDLAEQAGINTKAFGLSQSFSGFVPNFSSPIQQAKKREMAAGYEPGEVKVAKSRTLVSPLNPEGYGVYNSDEGSLVKGMSLARKAGIDPKTKGIGMKAEGYVPNFAGNQNYRKAERKAQRKARKARKAIPNSETRDGGTFTLDAVVGDFTPPQSSINLPPRQSRLNRNAKGPAIRRNLVFKGGDNAPFAPPAKLDNSLSFASSKGVSAAFDKIKAPKDTLKRVATLQKEVAKAEKNKDTAKADSLRKQIELEKRSAIGIDSANKILKLKQQLEKAEQKGDKEKANKIQNQINAEKNKFSRSSPERIAQSSTLNTASRLSSEGINPLGPSVKDRFKSRLEKSKDFLRGKQDEKSLERRGRLASTASFASFALTSIGGSLLGPEEERTSGQRKAGNVIESVGTAASTAGLLGFGPLAVAVGTAVGAFQFFSKAAKDSVGDTKDSSKELDKLKTSNQADITASSEALGKKEELANLEKSGAPSAKIAKVREEYRKALGNLQDRDLADQIASDEDLSTSQERVQQFQQKKQSEVELKEGLFGLENLAVQKGQQRIGGVKGALSGFFDLASFQAIDDDEKETFRDIQNGLKKPKEKLDASLYDVGLDPLLKQITAIGKLSPEASAGLENLKTGVYDLPQFLQRFGGELGLSEEAIKSASKSFNLLGQNVDLVDFEKYAAEAFKFQASLNQVKFPEIKVGTSKADSKKLFDRGLNNLNFNAQVSNLRNSKFSQNDLALKENQLRIDSTSGSLSEKEQLIRQASLDKENSKQSFETKGRNLLIDSVKKLTDIVPEDVGEDQRKNILNSAQSVLSGDSDLADLQSIILKSLESEKKSESLLEKIAQINLEIAQSSEELAIENESSTTLISGILKQNLEQVKAQTLKDLGENALSGKSKEALGGLEGRDFLAEAKLQKEITDLEKKAQAPGKTSKERNALLQQAAEKNLELQRITEKASKDEETLGGKGFVSKKAQTDKTAEFNRREGLAVQTKNILESMNRAGKGTGNIPFSPEIVEKILLGIRTGDNESAKNLINKGFDRGGLNELQRSIGLAFQDLGGEEFRLFPSPQEEPVKEEVSQPLAVPGTSRIANSVATNGANAAQVMEQLKNRPKSVIVADQAASEYNKIRGDLTSFQSETKQLAKEGKLTPELSASRAEEEKTIQANISKKREEALYLRQKAAPEIEKRDKLLASITAPPSFKEQKREVVPTPKVEETKSSQAQQVQRKEEKSQRQAAEMAQVDNKSLEASIKELTTAVKEFSKSGSTDTSKTTKIDQNVSISIDVGGQSLTSEQITKLKSEMLADLEARIRDLQKGVVSPPKKQ